jgi:hypothetical protein
LRLCAIRLLLLSSDGKKRTDDKDEKRNAHCWASAKQSTPEQISLFHLENN